MITVAYIDRVILLWAYRTVSSLHPYPLGEDRTGDLAHFKTHVPSMFMSQC